MKKILLNVLKYIGFFIVLLILLLILILGGFSLSSALRESKTALELAPHSGMFVQTPGGNIFIQEQGPKSGTPLIFIHGSLAWSETWKDVTSELSASGYRTIAIDLPPFGFSDRPADSSYSAKQQAQRIIELVDSLGLQKPVLVGHSFGGSPTVEAAMMAPYKFGGLVLVDVAVDPNFKAPESNNPLLEFFFKTGPFKTAVLTASLTNPMLTQTLLQGFIYRPEDATPEIVEIYQRPLSLEHSTRDLGNWLPALIFPETGLLNQQRASYQNLNLPSLIIWGEKDNITPISIGYELDELIPNSEIIVLEEVGHIPQIEDAPQLNEALINGLDKLNLK